MGLDVYLYQFKNRDMDATLKLWQFSEEPWAFEAFERWHALPQSERGVFPSEKDKAESRKKMTAKAQELGLSEEVAMDPNLGGTKISFPSKQHPQWPVGEWYSFSTVRELIAYATGKDFYFVMPEARNIHGFFRPDWMTARKRLANILGRIKELNQTQIEDFHSRFVMPDVQELLKKMKPAQLASASEIFARLVAQIEVMIETLDFVLNSGNSKEFLFYWSD